MKTYINRYVSTVEEHITSLMNYYCGTFSRYRLEWGSRLPWFCGVTPSPSPAPSLSPSPSPTGTPTPTPSPSPTESPTPTLTPTPTPTPTPTVSPTPTGTPSPSPSPSGHLLITEVFYDVDATHGVETDNEWVEIYNNSSSAWDVSSYLLADAISSDAIPSGTSIPAFGYLIVASKSTTAGFWSFPGSATVVYLEASIGNGLGNDGDALYLKDAGGTTIDALSWTTNTDVFNPATPDAPEGSSLARTSPTTDTNAASDWAVITPPTPGT